MEMLVGEQKQDDVALRLDPGGGEPCASLTLRRGTPRRRDGADMRRRYVQLGMGPCILMTEGVIR